MSPPPAAPLPSDPAMPANDEHWFREQVQVHEPALRAFLRSRFPKLMDVEDLIHDAYAKMLRARMTTTILHPKAFLFTTARHTALSHFRHAQVVHIEHEDVDRYPTPAEARALMEGVSPEEEEKLLHEAIATLPPRCREVLTLRKMHGLSRGEIAAKLGMAPNTVNAHLSAALAGCRKFFIARGFLQTDES